MEVKYKPNLIWKLGKRAEYFLAYFFLLSQNCATSHIFAVWGGECAESKIKNTLRILLKIFIVKNHQVGVNIRFKIQKYKDKRSKGLIQECCISNSPNFMKSPKCYFHWNWAKIMFSFCVNLIFFLIRAPFLLSFCSFCSGPDIAFIPSLLTLFQSQNGVYVVVVVVIF